MHHPLRLSLVSLLTLLLLSACTRLSDTPGLATLAGITVSNTNDSGEGSLRQAIAAAVSGDTITFGVTDTITLASTLVINKDLTIAGPEGSSVTISGNNSVRVFFVESGTTAELRNLTITGGWTTGSGGGIINYGTLTVTNSTISGNIALSGGGIANASSSSGRPTLNITNSTISGNIANSTSSGGGGIANYGFNLNRAPVTVTNSTISGNIANAAGGGIYSHDGNLTVTNSTITNNSAHGGGGIYDFLGNSANPFLLTNNIISLNTVTTGWPDLLANWKGDRNIIGTQYYDVSTGGHIDVGSPGLELDSEGKPKLADNGGPTKTIALIAGSPALDKALSASCPATDQRGVKRPQGCDLGAFELVHQLAITKDGAGSGTVESNPAGIDCGDDCSANFNHNASVTLTASAALGSSFDTATDWSGAGTTNDQGERVVSMSEARNVTATFTQDQYSLTTTVTPQGSGTVAADPAGPYTHGQVVTLTATPVAGYTFSGWSGDLSGNTNPATLTMTGDKSVTATFTLNSYTLAVTKAGTGSGIITSTPSGIDCGTTCSANYNHNTSVTLTGTSDTGSGAVVWSSGNGTTNSDGSYTVSMTEARNVTATFSLNQYSLTTTVSGSGSISASPDQASYSHGSQVTLTATPAAGWSFSGWSGDLSGNADSATITMDSNKSVTATFTRETSTAQVLTISVSGQGTVTSSPAGINCTAAGGPCSASFSKNAQVTLSAAPAAGWGFSSWSGDASGGQNPITITMSANRSVTATFIQLNNGPVVSINANGTVNRQTGVATLSGFLTCSPGSYPLKVTLSQQVRQGKTTVTLTGSQNITAACNSSWTASISPTSGKFTTGAVTVKVVINGVETTQTVQLK